MFCPKKLDMKYYKKSDNLEDNMNYNGLKRSPEFNKLNNDQKRLHNSLQGLELPLNFTRLLCQPPLDVYLVLRTVPDAIRSRCLWLIQEIFDAKFDSPKWLYVVYKDGPSKCSFVIERVELLKRQEVFTKLEQSLFVNTEAKKSV